MRVISFIEEPKVIDKIIHHLKLTFEAQRPPPHHFVQQELLIAAGLLFIDFEGKAYRKTECGTGFGELLRFGDH